MADKVKQTKSDTVEKVFEKHRFDALRARFLTNKMKVFVFAVFCGFVLIAAGFLGTESYIAKAFGVELNQRTNVATEEGHYATNVKNVFTAGDMHRGQSLVVWAIREGREVAREVDESLMGYSYLSIQ